MSQQPPPPPTGPYGNVPPPPPVGAPRPAELLDRFLGALIDGVILGIGFGIISAVFNGIFLGYSNSLGELFLYWAFTAVLFTAIALGYFGLMESSSGQTVGKMIIKTKVVAPGGGNPSLEQAVRRHIYFAAYLAFIVPVIGPVIGGLALLGAYVYIAMTINADTVGRQGWHDKFAGGTQVLKIG